MSSLREIAAVAGVSIQTASMVLKGREKEGRISATRAAAIREIADRLKYRPNSAARAMREQRSSLAGVLIQSELSHNASSPGAIAIAMGCNGGLDAAGYVMCFIRLADVLGGSDADGSRRLRSRVFRERMLEGMIIVNAVPMDLKPHIEELVPRCVWVDHNHFAPRCCVRRDEVHAGRTAVTELHKLGYRKILYSCYTRQSNHYSEANRFLGVQTAARELGMELDVLAYPWITPMHEPPSRVAALTPEWAVLTYSSDGVRDMIAFAAQTGKQVGRDFALVSVDESSDLFGSQSEVARVTFNRRQMGERAAQMLLEYLERPHEPPASVELRGEWQGGLSAPPRPPR